MASVWGELKRRNVVKVAVAYAIVGWLLVEVSSTVFPVLQIPDWAIALVTMLLILGFPIALILSWAYEITPEGMKRSHEVEATESITHVTGRKLDLAIIGALLLALGFVVYNYVLDDGEEAAGILPNSVAVLPFDNMSADPDDAYFAAGIHDEILNQLAKLKNLNVIARTSVMQYAGAARPITEIARELNVGTIMEGSVSYADDRVAVRAQLIDAETGVHLWSDSYNREFSDVFGIQSDIAMNVANALEAEFSFSEQESIEKIPTQSEAAYAVYLRALSSRAADSYRSNLNQAIALDPEFALAYAARAVDGTFQLVGVGLGSAPDEASELERSIYEDAERALSIDPTLGAAHAALAAVHQANWRGVAAEQAFQRAVELNPNDLDVLLHYGRFKRYRGDYEEAGRLMRRVIELNPNVAAFPFQLGLVYRDAARWEAAAAAIQDSLEQDQADLGRNINLALVEAARGNAAEAVRRLQLAEEVARPSASMPVFRLAQMAQAYALAGRPEEARRNFTQFEERAIAEGVGEGWWATAYIAVGDYDQALRRIELAVNERVSVDQSALATFAANPWGDPELEKPEFRALLDNLWGE